MAKNDLGVNVTRTLLDVVSILKRVYPNPIVGADLCRETGIATGTIYPMLRRLEQKGWLTSEWEDTDPHIRKQSKRRIYWITELGREKCSEILSEK